MHVYLSKNHPDWIWSFPEACWKSSRSHTLWIPKLSMHSSWMCLCSLYKRSYTLFQSALRRNPQQPSAWWRCSTWDGAGRDSEPMGSLGSVYKMIYGFCPTPITQLENTQKANHELNHQVGDWKLQTSVRETRIPLDYSCPCSWTFCFVVCDLWCRNVLHGTLLTSFAESGSRPPQKIPCSPLPVVGADR